MNYKIEGAMRRNKKYFILFAILWLFIAIVLIVPLVTAFNISVPTDNSLGALGVFVDAMKNPFKALATLISEGYFIAYVKCLGVFSIIFAIFFIIGVARSAPKNEYTDFEHGSSDWSKNRRTISNIK